MHGRRGWEPPQLLLSTSQGPGWLIASAQTEHADCSCSGERRGFGGPSKTCVADISLGTSPDAPKALAGAHPQRLLSSPRPPRRCSDESLTIRLDLLLEPDLRLRFASRQQYGEWATGLRLLLALLLRPDAPLQHRSLGRRSGASGSGRRGSSVGKEVVLQISDGTAGPAAGAGSRQEGGPAAPAGKAAAASSGVSLAAGVVRRALTINTGRVCARSNSHQHLEAAAARSQAALAAVVASAAGLAGAAGAEIERQASQDDAQKQEQGGGLRRTATISLVASASLPSMPDPALEPSFKLTSSEGAVDLPCSARQQLGRASAQHTQPRRGAWQRLRQLLRAGGRAASADGSATGANGSPSRQPLRAAGALQPSSSSGDLLVGASQQSQVTMEGQAGQEEGQPSPGQPVKPAAGYAGRHERVPTLKLWAESQQQQQQQMPVPPLDLAQLAGSSTGSGTGAGDSSGSQEPGPPSLVPAHGQCTGGSRGAEAEARPTPRLLLQGPFIHLQVGEQGADAWQEVWPTPTLGCSFQGACGASLVGQ